MITAEKRGLFFVYCPETQKDFQHFYLSSQYAELLRCVKAEISNSGVFHSIDNLFDNSVLIVWKTPFSWTLCVLINENKIYGMQTIRCI